MKTNEKAGRDVLPQREDKKQAFQQDLITIILA
jgi:hypothetical protein